MGAPVVGRSLRPFDARRLGGAPEPARREQLQGLPQDGLDLGFRIHLRAHLRKCCACFCLAEAQPAKGLKGLSLRRHARRGGGAAVFSAISVMEAKASRDTPLHDELAAMARAVMRAAERY